MKKIKNNTGDIVREFLLDMLAFIILVTLVTIVFVLL